MRVRTILMLIDGCRQPDAVMRDVVGRARRGEVGAIHLLTVRPRLNRHIGQFIGAAAIRAFQLAEGRSALAAARQPLLRAGLSHITHIGFGETAAATVAAARELRVDEIVVGADGDGLLGNLLQRLLVARLIARAAVPVLVVRAPAAAPMLSPDRIRPAHP